MFEEPHAKIDAATPPVDGPDHITMSRWTPGVLPELAHLLGLSRTSVRDLPSWFKFPVNATAGTVIQPAFDFLASMARARGRKARETCLAYGYDLRSWFEFLAIRQQTWESANQATVDDFVQEMACAELAGETDEDRWSPSESLGLGRSTIRRRVAALVSFYKHASPAGPPFHGKTGRNAGRIAQESVRPIPPEEIETFLGHLGPRPSTWTGAGSSRLWCCAAIALSSGMRRMEVCGLDVGQIRTIPFERTAPFHLHPILLTTTKGGLNRAVLVPAWLVEELVAYIDGERRAGSEAVADHEPLFVNYRHSRRSPASRLQPATLSFDFRNAVLAADARRKNPAFRYGTGASEKLHTFHDLRHTCACVLYLELAGTHDPWIEVQNRLGHRLLKTTTDVYLRFVDEMRKRPQDMRQMITHGMLTS